MATEHQAKELWVSSRKGKVSLALRDQSFLVVALMVRLKEPDPKLIKAVCGNRFKERRFVLEVAVGCHGGHACIPSNRSEADLLAPLQRSQRGTNKFYRKLKIRAAHCLHCTPETLAYNVNSLESENASD